MNGSYGRFGTTKDGAASTAATGGAGAPTKGSGWNTVLSLVQEYGDDVIDIIQTGRGAQTPTSASGTGPGPSSTGTSGTGFRPQFQRPEILEQRTPQTSAVGAMGAGSWTTWLIGGAIVVGAGLYLSRR